MRRVKPQLQAISLLLPGRHDGQGYVNTLLAAAGCLYRALRWAAATDADPFNDVRVPKDRTSGLVKCPPYSEDEVAEVLEQAGVQERFLLFLVCHAGLRIREALDLNWADLDEAGRRIHVVSGKGRKARLVAMSGSLARASRASGHCLGRAAVSTRMAKG